VGQAALPAALAIGLLAGAFVDATGFASRAGAATTVDPCLVGTWRSAPVVAAAQPPVLATATGLSGIVLTIDSSGAEVVRYDGSAPLQTTHQVINGTPFTETQTYRGTTHGVISAQNGQAQEVTPPSPTATEQTDIPAHAGQAAQSETATFAGGPGFLGSIYTGAYRCSAGTLSFGGTATVALTFAGGGAATTPGGGQPPAQHSHPGARTSGVPGYLIGIIFGLALLALALGGWLWTRERRTRRRKPAVETPACACTLSISITGPERAMLNCGEHPATFDMIRDGSLSGALSVGAGLPLKYFAIHPLIECTGGGTVEIDGTSWAAVRADRDHLTVTATVVGATRCPDKPPTRVSATASMQVTLSRPRCCGPDITDGFVASVNRTYRKLEQRISHPQFSATSFFLEWGDRMVYRPYTHGQVFDDGCPGEGCNDTVTMLGSCYDCYVTDNLLFGIVGGFVKMPLVELEAGGWAAKLVKQFEMLAHMTSEELWRRGHDIGSSARSTYDRSGRASFDRQVLAGGLRGVPQHESCSSCSEVGPTPAFIDFADAAW
jgi:hypothetical protein